jgi:UDP:flavonoid glycosyltransferase YjiC (YdhE family)
MRILFAFTGGRGHLEPLVPIARAAEAAGHTVSFTGRQALVPAVEALGFDVSPTGPEGIPERRPLRAVDLEREYRDLRAFAERIAGVRADGVLALCADLRPDLIVCDEVDFGSMIGAERLEIPYASVLVIATGSFVRPDLVADPLNALRAEHGLRADPQLEMLSRYLVLSPFPPGFRDPAFPLPATAHGVRLTIDPAEDIPPAWLDGLRQPAVYATLGTVFNIESGDLFARLLEGLGALPLEAVATVGNQIDPAELGPLPANVHVERFVPQDLVLPRCDAVVCHGGSGSVLGALTYGLPLVVIPLGADQPLNAARCEELRLARVLDAVRATPDDVGEAVSAVLSNPAYRRAAERMRDEVAALPGPEVAVALLERLAADRR